MPSSMSRARPNTAAALLIATGLSLSWSCGGDSEPPPAADLGGSVDGGATDAALPTPDAGPSDGGRALPDGGRALPDAGLCPTGCDDGDPCTLDLCEPTGCANPPTPAGGACPTGVCDGSGACVTCVDDTQCAGDLRCDPVAGACVGCVAPSDCDDADLCTADTCVAGACAYELEAEGTSCGAGVCDSTGACVACLSDTDCGGATPLCGAAGTCEEGVRLLTAGWLGSCALRTDGQLLCWGDNSDGETGTNMPAVAVLTTPTPVALSSVVDVDRGYDHACAATASGEAFCWGSNAIGQLGDGTMTRRDTPTRVTGLGDVTHVEAGEDHSCALTSMGAVWCWGDNSRGQLGVGAATPAMATTPTQVTGLTDVVDLALGDHFACALRRNGTLACWGDNTAGTLGIGASGNRDTPTEVTGVTDAVQVSAGESSACVRRMTGELLCWGHNSGGALGDGTTTHRWSPVPVSGISDAVDIAAGWWWTCAVTAAGTAYCWGIMPDGTRLRVPVALAMPAAPTGVDGSYDHMCFLHGAGRASCFGGNTYGQLGNGTSGGVRDALVSVDGF